MTPDEIFDEALRESRRAQDAWHADAWYQMNLRAVVAAANATALTLRAEGIEQPVIDRVVRTLIYGAVDPTRSEQWREMERRFTERLKTKPVRLSVEDLKGMGFPSDNVREAP